MLIEKLKAQSQARPTHVARDVSFDLTLWWFEASRSDSDLNP